MVLSRVFKGSFFRGKNLRWPSKGGKTRGMRGTDSSTCIPGLACQCKKGKGGVTRFRKKGWKKESQRRKGSGGKLTEKKIGPE